MHKYARKPSHQSNQKTRLSGSPNTLTKQNNQSRQSIRNILQSPIGQGQPLSNKSLNFFQSRFGADLSDVHIHADTDGNKAADKLNAKAFTSGKDIVFAKGKYSPNTNQGRHLLAHELTHVMQQNHSNSAGVGHIQRTPNEYDNTAFTLTPPPKSMKLKKAQKRANDEVTAGNLSSVAIAGGTGNQEIFLWYALSQLGGQSRWGTELDLITDIDWAPKGGTAPQGQVSVIIDDAGNATATLISAGVPSSSSSFADANAAKTHLKTTYGFVDITAGSKTWDLEELKLLDGAFKLLDATDQKALTGVTLKRYTTLNNGRAGEFSTQQELDATGTSATNEAVLKLADGAFDHDDKSFVGGTTATYPASYRTIIHEVGHAIEGYETFIAAKAANDAVVAHNLHVPVQNQAAQDQTDDANNLNANLDLYDQAKKDKKAAKTTADKNAAQKRMDAATKQDAVLRPIYDAAKKKAETETKKLEALNKTQEQKKQDHQDTMIPKATSDALEKAATDSKADFDKALAAANKTADAFKDPEKQAAQSYRDAINDTTTAIDLFITASGQSPRPANMDTLEDNAVAAIENRANSRKALTPAAPKSPALAAFSAVDSAQDSWFGNARIFHHAKGRTKRLQAFVDFVTSKSITPFTEYAADNWPHKPEEFYAEAYSFWITDPDYLETNFKDLYDWFKAGNYR